jgi:hypothetical protein
MDNDRKVDGGWLLLSPGRLFRVGISIIAKTVLPESSDARQLGSQLLCVFSAEVFP